jgi:dipeptidase E
MGYKKTGIRNFICIPVDRTLSKNQEKALLSADAIFLGGGNTFYFLNNLRKRKLLPKLRKYARQGGLLMGLSAGSILMTPNITTAAGPSMDSDDNEIGLKNWRALGLVPFEFSPHYYRSAAVDRELQNYSRKMSRPIYACADGQGIVVRNGAIRFVGRVSIFRRGSKSRA